MATIVRWPPERKPVGDRLVIPVQPIVRPNSLSCESTRALDHALSPLQRWDEKAPISIKTDAGLASAILDRRISGLIDRGAQIPHWPPLKRMLERPCGRAAAKQLGQDLQNSTFSPTLLLACAGRLQSSTELCWRAEPQFIRSRSTQLERQFCEPAEVEKHLRQLCAIGPSIMHPLERAVFVLANILSIHPLLDGNGRLARAAFSAVLIAEDALIEPLPLGALLYLNAHTFVAALNEAQGRQDLIPLVHFFVRMASKLGEIADTMEKENASDK